MKKLTQRQLRSLILKEVRRNKARGSSKPTLATLLFEAEKSDSAEEAQEADVEGKVLLVLYGPPAAGKGAAKKLATGLAGKELKKGEDNFKDFLGNMTKSEDAETQEKANMFFQEEDKRMTDATTKELPPLVFAEVHLAGGGTESEPAEDQAAFESAVEEHFHVNENGDRKELADLLSWNTYTDLMKKADGDPTGAAEAFLKFPETSSWFAQARGWSKEVEGFSMNEWTGVTDDPELTLGFRWFASEQFMEDVENDLEDFLKSDAGAEETAANIYLADQAGESSANIDRIGKFGEMKIKHPGLAIVGAYIYQPADRTKIANLHRKAFDTGGRRVAQSEVERIYDNAPEVDVSGDSVNVTKEGPAVQAMVDADFDSVYVFAPPDAFDPEKEKSADGRNVGASICQPFGDGTGYFSIEGCDEFAEGGGEADAEQYAGMEKKAVNKAKLDDKEGFEDGFIPDKINSKEKQKLLNALNDMGFDIKGQQLLKYMKNYAPPGSARSGGSEFGANTWSKKLFAKGGNPTSKSANLAKGESVRTQNSGEIIVERWQKLAGILND